jgi:energy-converting hydrogenase A subunit I
VKKIMDKLKIISWVLFIGSIGSILYALIFNPSSYIVYAIALISIPVSVLSFGLVGMARGSKDEDDDKRREPFIGY